MNAHFAAAETQISILARLRDTADAARSVLDGFGIGAADPESLSEDWRLVRAGVPFDVIPELFTALRSIEPALVVQG